MNEDERQYADRIEYRRVLGYETESMNCDPPEWIINLKNYFEKDIIRSNYSSQG